MAPARAAETGPQRSVEVPRAYGHERAKRGGGNRELYNEALMILNILVLTALLMVAIVVGSWLIQREPGRTLRPCRRALGALRQELDLEEESHEIEHPGGVFKYAISSSTEDRGIDFTLWRHWHDHGAWHVDVEPRGFSNLEAFKVDIGHGTIEQELKKVVAAVRERLEMGPPRE